MSDSGPLPFHSSVLSQHTYHVETKCVIQISAPSHVLKLKLTLVLPMHASTILCACMYDGTFLVFV